MELHILLVEPDELRRKGLRTLLETIRLVVCIEAATIQEMEDALVSYPIDLVVIHQSLISAIDLLPTNHFVIMADQPDIALLKLARIYEAQGIIQENPSLELLREVLKIAEKGGEKSFWLDPDLAPDLLDALLDVDSNAVDRSQLTPAELKVFNLLRSGLKTTAVARQLSITPDTVRKHVYNIAKKVGMPRKEFLLLSLSNNKQKGKG
jgi:DNA-binding NarL/FixJ family response regulator